MATLNFDRLSQLPFLQNFTQDEMGAFFSIGRKVRAEAGKLLMAAGDKADCFYILAIGHAEISIRGKKGEPSTLLAQVAPGQLLGEMPLLYSQPIRQADVHATTDVVMLRFDYPALDILSQAQPILGKKFRTNLGKIVASRVWSTIPEAQGPAGGKQELPAPVKSNSHAGESSRELIQKAPIFAGLTEREIEHLESIAIPLNAQPDQVVVRTGDPSDSFFLITQGSLEVILIKEGERIPIARLNEGQVFGEMALVYQQKARTADVIAVTNTRLLTFPFEDYKRLIAGQPEIGKRLRSNLARVAASRSWSISN